MVILLTHSLRIIVGKSLQVVTLVHTLFNHPNLRPQEDEEARQFIHTVLLVVPVNTIANWKNEFERWTDKLEHTVRVFDVSEVKKEARLRMIRTWSDRGGVLLIGSDLYSNLLKKNDCLSKVSLLGMTYSLSAKRELMQPSPLPPALSKPWAGYGHH